MKTKLKLSKLDHTWFIDVDGTIVIHNGHKQQGDRLLPGVAEFWNSIPDADTIVLCSARTEKERESTLGFIAAQGLRYDHVLFGLPTGERILVNDEKPKGLSCAIAVNVPRNEGLSLIEPELIDDLAQGAGNQTSSIETMLSEKRVSDFLSTVDGAVLTIEETACADVSRVLMQQNCSVVMLVDDAGQLSAVISDGDIRRAFSEFGPLGFLSLQGSRIATDNPITCQSSDTLWHALSLMEAGERQISCLPVLDDAKRPLGIITLHAILQVIATHQTSLAKSSSAKVG